MKLWKLGGVLTLMFLLLSFVGAVSPQGAGAQAKGDPKKGEDVFVQNCELCHETQTDEIKIGPSLKELFKKSRKMSNGKEGIPTEADVRRQIEQGGEMMAPMEGILSPEEINDVIAYLHTV